MTKLIVGSSFSLSWLRGKNKPFFLRNVSVNVFQQSINEHNQRTEKHDFTKIASGINKIFSFHILWQMFF